MKIDVSLTLYNLGTSKIQLYIHDIDNTLDRHALRDEIVSEAKERLHVRLESRPLFWNCGSFLNHLIVQFNFCLIAMELWVKTETKADVSLPRRGDIPI